MLDTTLAQAPLGHEVQYPQKYDASLLFPIARSTNRNTLPIHPVWHGADIWNAYELSWLNNKGKPIVAVGRFTFPHDSPYLIESKSLKLYLNSFNEERFDSTDTVLQRIQQDLNKAAQSNITISLQGVDNNTDTYQPLTGQNIDDADIEIDHYLPTPGLLHCLTNPKHVSETLVSDLLKSNCPVTGQPDWGSVQIRYSGLQIDHNALLKYIVSLRHHSEFHEHCVEKMYCDIWQACQPESLSVYARYTRRGGLDINPWRSSEPMQASQSRTLRQ